MNQTTKKLKFASPLISLILSGEKTSTWRLFDDKNLTRGDIFEIVEHGTLKSYGLAEIIKLERKVLSELTEEDKRGHETFTDEEEMYRTYEKYYQKPVTPNTIVKIIRFKRLD